MINQLFRFKLLSELLAGFSAAWPTVLMLTACNSYRMHWGCSLGGQISLMVKNAIVQASVLLCAVRHAKGSLEHVQCSQRGLISEAA
jgi:hypothetical protein